MKIKYALALALSHGAELLILDEPTSGLDPVSREELVEVFLRLKDEGKTVIEGDPELEVSRHFLELARKLLEQEREENRSENGSE